jgi:hypothetical protein
MFGFGIAGTGLEFDNSTSQALSSPFVEDCGNHTSWRVELKIKTIALFAVLAACVPMSAASAMNVAKSEAITSSSSVLHKTDYAKRKYRHKRRQHYKAGHRYNKAPSNWHRHHKRPGDWQRRGCITVGSIWWCP